MKILCLFGIHRRSRGRARAEGARYVSQCVRCAVPLEKTRTGAWVVLKDAK